MLYLYTPCFSEYSVIFVLYSIRTAKINLILYELLEIVRYIQTNIKENTWKGG